MNPSEHYRTLSWVFVALTWRSHHAQSLWTTITLHATVMDCYDDAMGGYPGVAITQKR